MLVYEITGGGWHIWKYCKSKPWRANSMYSTEHIENKYIQIH